MVAPSALDGAAVPGDTAMRRKQDDAPPRSLLCGPRLPRELTPELRRRHAVPAPDETPYRWSFAALLVGLAAVPLLAAGWVRSAIALALFALAGVPASRWLARKDAEQRERIFTHGKETYGQVLDVEPAGPNNKDRSLRVELWVEGERVTAVVQGCPLARRGLGPGDDVRVLYDEGDPRKCLVVEKAKRPVIDAV